jgi:predicted dinucleotide-binding enzyme
LLSADRTVNRWGELMRIGIIGVGHIGSTLAEHFVRAGHEVVVSNSRGPETLVELVTELGDRASAATAADAVRTAEIVVVSVPFGRHRDLPVEGIAGKVVVDTNNYYPQRDGHFGEIDDDRSTSSELLQQHLSGSRVVKAFNAMYWEHLRDLGRPAGDPGRIGIPISGDDADAKRVVADLIDDIGFDAVDAGSLAQGGRRHQPGGTVYAADLPTAELRAELAA